MSDSTSMPSAPTEDCLLSAAEAGAICKVSRSRFDAYVRRFPLLMRGRRLVQATPGGRGTMRYLKSSVIAHLHLELTAEREPTPDADDAVARAREEAVALLADARKCVVLANANGYYDVWLSRCDRVLGGAR